MRVLWEILVPTVRNDGKPFRTRYHRVWDERVREISGGLSVIHPIKGQWVAGCGTLYAERMIPVRFMGTREEADQIADMTAAYYDQKAVMYYRISEEVYIKHYGPRKD